MFGFEKLQKDSNAFFTLMKQQNYCESMYSGSNQIRCDILQQRIKTIQEGLERRKDALDSPYLKSDDKWIRKEITNIRKDIFAIRNAYGV